MEREKFASRLGFILVSAGCAVGLGNVWKFPYICGKNGGAVFILIYLAFLILLGLPILASEFTIGRASKRSVAECYEILEPAGSKWHRFKWMQIIGNYLLMMFYTMVSGWMMAYAYKMISGELAGLDPDGVAEHFSTMLGSASGMAFWMIITVLIAFGICVIGLQKGIERITKVMMSLLIILIIVLAVHSVLLPNAAEGISFYLVPNMENLADRGLWPAIFDAMTHAFFTLSIGIGSMEIFGSYLGNENTTTKEASSVLVLDTFVAIMAGFIIIPACFAYGVQPDAGPSLLFITLPNVFNHMASGSLWGTMFFVFMTFAALSTVIAVFENIISFYMDMGGWSRKKAVALNIVLIILLSMPCIWGFNILADFHPLGGSSGIMDLEDFLVSYNLLPLGSMIFVLFAVRKNGWGWENFLKEANTGKGAKFRNGLRFYMTWILPVIIAVIYLKGYYDFFAAESFGIRFGWMVFAILLLLFIFSTALFTGKKQPR